ncbi:GAGA-binding transcriptional activator [Dillenia turbinata]|uniref:GAGA-binding transcriptional activator n=1 Tax=Dillenia turbinata TaxID=194707 RepID=A0AAN8UYI1_9MAGN
MYVEFVMDDGGGLGVNQNLRTWGHYYVGGSIKGHLGLQLMPERDTKAFLPRPDHTVTVGPNGGTAYHHSHRDTMVSESTVVPMDYVRDSWMHQREKFLNMLPGNPNFAILHEPSAAHAPIHMVQQQQQQQQHQPQPDSLKDERLAGVEESGVKKERTPSKKREANAVPKTPKPKRAKKGPSVPREKGNSMVQRTKGAKKNVDVVINGIEMDISGIPIPVCSCTGNPQQCYRWGSGGWQSACCTTSISTYPLPMSTKRRGSRIAGRKMSQGAFKKIFVYHFYPI